MKLSKRGCELLSLIEQRSILDESGQFQLYYVPTVGDGVSGSGDANCLRGLERKGLIKRMSDPSSYSYIITEEGRELCGG